VEYLNQIMRRILLLPPQASSVAKQIDWLHYVVISVTMLGAAAIALVGVFFCIRYRHPAGPLGGRRRQAPTPTFSAELIAIGGLFTLFVAWWAVGFWQYVKIASPPANAYDVYVSGKQWMWKFAYPDGSHTLDTLYVPAGKPVRLILTSRDVIHSFYVPDFRVKHDAVPGRYTTLWFTAEAPGTHRILCAEYCGTWHSRMLGQVAVLSDTDFQRWLREGERERSYPLDPDLAEVSDVASSLVQQGERVAAKYGCLRCHSVDGSPHIGPTWVGLYQAQVPLAVGDPVVADVAYLTESMMDPNAKLHRGYAAVMPSYVGYLRPAEVGAVVTYIQSLQTPSLVSSVAPVGDPEGGVYRLPGSSPTPAAPPAGAIGRPASQPARATPAAEGVAAPLLRDNQKARDIDNGRQP
jgi:cytochrome c oxidase subunit 2